MTEKIPNYREIVWLASFPKSGNTWLRCFLDAYFLNDLDINDIVTSVTDDVTGLYSTGDGYDITKAPIDIQQLCRPMAMLRLVNMHRKTRGDSLPLFVKTHTPHLLANGIEYHPENLTKAVVYLVRDPRDVMPSYARHMGVDHDKALDWMQDKYRTLSGNDARVSELVSSWDGHVQSYLNATSHNVLWVRYEDLLAAPEKYFSKILKHAGIDPDPDKVKAAIEMTRLERLKKKEQEAGFRESSPFAKNAFFGDGGTARREELTPKHLHRINKAFGRLMKRLGYIDKRVAA